MPRSLSSTLLLCLSKQHVRLHKKETGSSRTTSTSQQPMRAQTCMNFAMLSSIVYVFRNAMDARQALHALLTQCTSASRAQLLYAREAITELLHRHDRQTVSEIAHSSVQQSAHSQLLGYARQGCCFINTQSDTKADTEEVRRCVQRFHPTHVQTQRTQETKREEAELPKWPTVII